jgi:hypothetical protein
LVTTKDEKDGNGNTPSTIVSALAAFPLSSSTGGFPFRSTVSALNSSNKATALLCSGYPNDAIRIRPFTISSDVKQLEEQKQR